MWRLSFQSKQKLMCFVLDSFKEIQKLSCTSWFITNKLRGIFILTVSFGTFPHVPEYSIYYFILNVVVLQFFFFLYSEAFRSNLHQDWSWLMFYSFPQFLSVNSCLKIGYNCLLLISSISLLMIFLVPLLDNTVKFLFLKSGHLVHTGWLYPQYKAHYWPVHNCKSSEALQQQHVTDKIPHNSIRVTCKGKVVPVLN
jgi:hypothetical protein